MEDHILVRYGELSLKKTNRRQFITKVTNHIKRSLSEYKDLTFESRGMRFYIILNNTNSEKIIEKLEKIPGVYSFSVVSRTNSDLESILALALDITKKEIGNKTFKVETNRADKNFPMTSLEISKAVSRHLFINIPFLKADMHSPECVLNIDVRCEGTFIYTKTYYGMGGLPAGSLGKVMLMVSGGIDSIVAGYLSIKKGMTVDAIHFESNPYTSDLALQKVVDLLEEISPYAEYLNINLFIVPFTDLQEAIYKNCRDDYCITIMRRMMYRITEEIANSRGALAIVNGENIGQVASQTLESINVIEDTVSIPVIRPLATLDKKDIMDIAIKIKTYDISIRPYEDCCTVFVPKHPVIRPQISIAKKEENKFDYQTLINEAITKTTKITLHKKLHYDVINKCFKSDDELI